MHIRRRLNIERTKLGIHEIGALREAAARLDGWPLLLWLTAGLLAGQSCGATVVCLLVVTAAGGGLAAIRVRARLAGKLVAFGAAAVFGFLQVQRLLHPDLPPDHVARLAGRPIDVRGIVAGRPRDGLTRRRVLVETTAVREKGGEWRAARGLVLVTIERPAQRWRDGDRLEAALRLRKPRNFGNPGEFDYASFLARRRIYATAFAPDDRGWRREAGATPLGWLEDWRERIQALIGASADGAAREILAALLVGTTDLSPEIRARYAQTGLSHILSISGLHISLVAAGAFTAIRWLLSRRERVLLVYNVPRIASAWAAIPVLLYAGIAGASVPTVRSVIMGMLVLLAVLIGRQRSAPAAIAAAALLICLVSPGAASEVSFQLSFAAVVFIVSGTRRLHSWWQALEERHRLLLDEKTWRRTRALVTFFGVTICAVAGTAPLCALHFNQFSVTTFVANPIVVPLLGTVPIGLGLLAAVLAPAAPLLAGSLLAVAGWIVGVADSIVAALARLPGSAVHVVTPTPVELAAMYGVLGAPLLGNRLRRIFLPASAALLCLTTVLRCLSLLPQDRLRVTFLSVGQGDCAVVELPTAEVMVIDGGGLSVRFDVGERVVAPYLWWRGIARVDYLVLTHPDYDHYGGFAFLVRNFAPRELWWNGERAPGPTFAALTTALEETRTPARIVRRGFARRFGGAEVTVLGPDEQPAAKQNDDSVTLRIRYAGETFLFPGDLEASGESELLAAAVGELRGTFLKVPHHGSRTSSTPAFLDAVRPRLAVVSAGFENRFRMPHPEVLEAYRTRGIGILRTDLHGAVTIEVRGNGATQVSHALPDTPTRRWDAKLLFFDFLQPFWFDHRP